MGQEKTSGESSARVTFRIPEKLPSLNDYIRACRANRYAGSQMKKDVEGLIGLYISRIPRFELPVRIDFVWIEDTKRRDYDNVAFAKKFVLDALVKSGKLPDDNRKHVRAFSDSFEYGPTAAVEVTITTLEEEICKRDS